MENLEQIGKSEEILELEAKPEVAFDLKPIRHGLRARALMLKGENCRHFNDLCNSLELEWSPRTPTEQFYVEQMAVSQWKLHRMQVVEYDAFFDKTPSAPGQIPLLERLLQCQARLERSYARAQHDLQRLQKTRPRTAPAPHYEEIQFTPDPQPDEEPSQPGPSAQVIDISTAKPATTPDGQDASALRPQEAEATSTEPRPSGSGFLLQNRDRQEAAFPEIPKTVKHPPLGGGCDTIKASYETP